MKDPRSICRSCQRQIPGGAQGCVCRQPPARCGSCGAALKPAMVRCRECNVLVSDTLVNAAAERQPQPVLKCQPAGPAAIPERRCGATRKPNVAPSAIDRGGAVRSVTSQTAGASVVSAAGASIGNSQQRQQSERPVRAAVTAATAANDGRGSWNWRVIGLLMGSIAGCVLAISSAMHLTLADSAPVSAAAHPVDTDTERSAALWVVDHFGVVTVRTQQGRIRRYVAAEHLPDEPFVIREINLYGQEFEESELAFLPQLAGLQKLDLSRTSCGKYAMQLAGQLSSLKAIYLRGNEVDATVVRALRNGSQIENCSVAGSSLFDDQTLEALAEVMPNLQSFSCAATNVSTEGLTTLTRLTSLQQLTLPKGQYSAASLDALAQALPDCRVRQ